jgi:hypothetical protein
MISRNTHRGFAALALLLNSLSCAPRQGGATLALVPPSPSQSAEPVATPAEGDCPPGTALTRFASNKFDPPWSVSLIRLGPDRPAFNKGDRVKLKARPDGPTMTVEYVSHPVYVISGKYAFDPSMFAFHYGCRWENKDGSESVGYFREEALEPVSVVGRN